jgi:hypothetical protein
MLRGEELMTEPEVRRTGVARTAAGIMLILVVAPVYLLLIPGREDLAVLLGGIVAFGVLALGVLLAGPWIGVFQRRRENPREQQQGYLQMLVTLLALLAGATILYYVVFYGAGVFMRGEL